MGGGPKRQQPSSYRDYVEEAVREGRVKSPWEKLQEQVVLGGQEFLNGLREHLVVGDAQEQRGVRRLREARPSLVKVIECVEAVKGEEWEDFRDRHGDEGRDLVLYLGRKVGGLKLKELAGAIGTGEYAAVGMAVRRMSARVAKDRTLQEICHRVTQMLDVKM